MKILKFILVIAVILLTILDIQALETNSDKQKHETSYNAQSKSVVVPEGKGKQVVIDGTFSMEERDDALSYSIVDKHNIYLKADSKILYIGLKFAKPIGECACEIRITSNEKEIFLLHVSGSLCEAVSGFPATTKFDCNNNKYWEGNFLMPDSLKNAAWIAAGRPLDKYSDIYDKRDGMEFRIHRKKFTDNSLKFTVGWLWIEAKGKNIDKKSYNYPESANLKNADNWIELILLDAKS